MTQKTALIAGATGLVGQELVTQISNGNLYQKVIVLSRREMTIEDDRFQVVVVDFDKLDDYTELFDVNHIYCCLGTTMKQAGSKELFKRIDVDYPVKMAEISKEKENFEAYFIVTAVGSNPDSPLFYNQVKGEVEKALKEMEINSLNIFQPSLLLGKRKDFRLWEEVAKGFASFLSFFVVGTRRVHIWSIKGEEVARCMLKVAAYTVPGTHVYKPKEMISLAHRP
ncbi:MAG: NAD-dependent epimerase/dehydratase family protein [Cyclobacteriaceae bacterium]